MQFFINQGRCRVCGKMCCCSKHQKEHERAQHKEHAYLLEKLPTVCRRCHRRINFVYDLHLGCRLYTRQGVMKGNFGHATTVTKFSRKRTLKQIENGNETLIQRATIPNEKRKKLIPAYKFKHTVEFQRFLASSENKSQLLVIGFNQIIMDSKSTFSPQLNISYKMLTAGIVKSSTPLNEEDKENSPLVNGTSQYLKTLEPSNTITEDFKKLEKTTYCTPELIQSSIVIISSSKKNTPPGIMANFSKRSTKAVVKNRKVTFELVKTPQLDNITVYATPTSTVRTLQQFHETDDGNLKSPGSPPACILVKIVKRVRTAIHRIPRSIYYALGWGTQKFKRPKSDDESTESEIQSPLKKRLKYDSNDFLQRRPITSHWVNMSVNSLFRKPLPNYVQTYYNDV